MSPVRTDSYLRSLVEELRQQPDETEWLEFKRNNYEPQAIGEYISALANSAAYNGKASAYLLWGIDDDSHSIVGTTFAPSAFKIGNEALLNWLPRQLTPELHFDFYCLETEQGRVVLLEIQAASHRPVQFQGQEFIRIGSHKKKLKEHPTHEQALWHIFNQKPFEFGSAAENLDADTVLKLLDYPAYFDLTGTSLPDGANNIIKTLESDALIRRNDAGGWEITNLGAILFARDLSEFPSLKRKSLRVILYDGNGRLFTKRERELDKGYAIGFESILDYINGLLPTNEVIGKALRQSVPMFPELAVRELIANALIHQDFCETGNGPMVEIFNSRMEITNPGLPLVETNRFLDSPPKSRNERLASLMRRIGICEERGSGVDKVVFQAEYYQLPAPSFETTGSSTRSILFAHKPFNEMDKNDRIRACYLHACLRFVSRQEMTNQSLRDRFKIEEKNRAAASRIISEAIEAKLILPADPKQGRRHAKYIPFWAGDLKRQ